MSYDLRQADASPDVIMARDEARDSRPRSESSSNPPVPITKVTKVDHSPTPAEVPGTHAYETHRQDAQPDVVEEQSDDAGKEAPS